MYFFHQFVSMQIMSIKILSHGLNKVPSWDLRYSLVHVPRQELSFVLHLLLLGVLATEGGVNINEQCAAISLLDVVASTWLVRARWVSLCLRAMRWCSFTISNWWWRWWYCVVPTMVRNDAPRLESNATRSLFVYSASVAFHALLVCICALSKCALKRIWRVKLKEREEKFPTCRRRIILFEGISGRADFLATSKVCGVCARSDAQRWSC
jgi:hypothetical protein